MLTNRAHLRRIFTNGSVEEMWVRIHSFESILTNLAVLSSRLLTHISTKFGQVLFENKVVRCQPSEQIGNEILPSDRSVKCLSESIVLIQSWLNLLCISPANRYTYLPRLVKFHSQTLLSNANHPSKFMTKVFHWIGPLNVSQSPNFISILTKRVVHPPS